MEYIGQRVIVLMTDLYLNAKTYNSYLFIEEATKRVVVALEKGGDTSKAENDTFCFRSHEFSFTGVSLFLSHKSLPHFSKIMKQKEQICEKAERSFRCIDCIVFYKL